MQRNGWSSTSLLPTNHILPTTSECMSRLSLRSSSLSHPRWYVGDAAGEGRVVAQIAYQELFPNQSTPSPLASGFL
jgi:hypothetical protein